ncbi:SRPBCC family protein [Desulfosediminicola flagellatus]|uniref:SRPBCC family protein n=1 Tax=Desulfosediminicola flagellatus TaxID=2569541 RepID=UPI0010AC96D1|nr:SRPBCC family protein [Desulfosediminicola flagellatus]
MISLTDSRFSVCKTINRPPEIVWNIITDTHHWPKWGPSVVDVDCTDRHIRSASHGRVKTAFRIWLPFTITTFIDMKSWSWHIGPFKATGHRISRIDEHSCTLCFDMAWWAVAYIPICWIALRKIDALAEKI